MNMNFEVLLEQLSEATGYECYGVTQMSQRHKEHPPTHPHMMFEHFFWGEVLVATHERVVKSM